MDIYIDQEMEFRLDLHLGWW